VKGCGALMAILLTDWLPPPRTAHGACLPFADRIFILDDEGFCDVPAPLHARTTYVGRVHQTFADRDLALARDTARARWNLAPDEVLIVVAPGGNALHAEVRSPLARTLAAAVERLSLPRKRVLWVADETENALIGEAFHHAQHVTVLPPHPDFLHTLAAADVVITKANRITIFEAEYVGVPSVSISYGVNGIDDRRIRAVASNAALRFDECSVDRLSATIRRQLFRPRRRQSDDHEAAARLAAGIRELIVSSQHENRPICASTRHQVRDTVISS
jgi:UDP-N-acetylglucosamine:LPS N-acetylglucosamine transferase